MRRTLHRCTVGAIPGDATHRRRRGSVFQRLFILALLAFVLPCLAQRPPIVIPVSRDTVLEQLPRGYAALEPRAKGRDASLTEAQALLAIAARTGDGRLAARAEGLLAALPAHEKTTAAALSTRAFAAQHRHDFAEALHLLDQAIAAAPRDANARLSHAQILLVQGRLDAARRDCAALALGVDADAGTLCIAALAMRRGNVAQAADLLDRWLARPSRDRDLLRYVLVMRGETASRSGDVHADAWFHRALALAPDDVRTLAAFARHLRAHGRDADAFALLTHAPDTDGLALQRVLAAQASRLPEAPRLAAALARRYALAHALDATPELRDEAEFALTVRGDAATALRLARKNFETQRDVEDIDLLQRATAAVARR